MVFGEHPRALSRDECKDVIKATEHLASNAFFQLDRKSEEERRELLARAHALTEHFLDSVAGENPMVASLALLGALRTLERFVQHEVEKRGKR